MHLREGCSLLRVIPVLVAVSFAGCAFMPRSGCEIAHAEVDSCKSTLETRSLAGDDRAAAALSALTREHANYESSRDCGRFTLFYTRHIAPVCVDSAKKTH